MTAGPAGVTDWNPETYARFRGLRLRPALDLLAQLDGLPAGEVVDLGCGSGAVAEALATRFADRTRIGVDNSPAMLAKAAATGCYHRLEESDIARWQPRQPVALIFSNAALQWLDGHDALLPRLAGCLVPGGVLAAQMPRQYTQPSHRFLRDIAQAMFPDRFDFSAWEPPVRAPTAWWELLSRLGRADVWETEYLQRLEPGEDAHPVRRFTESTAMRPFLDRMSAAEAGAFRAAYDAALASAYPVLADGSALMPFRRLFLVLKV